MYCTLKDFKMLIALLEEQNYKRIEQTV